MPNLMVDVAEVDVAVVTEVEVVAAVAVAEAAASHPETLHSNLPCPLFSEGGVGGCLTMLSFTFSYLLPSFDFSMIFL